MSRQGEKRIVETSVLIDILEGLNLDRKAVNFIINGLIESILTDITFIKLK